MGRHAQPPKGDQRVTVLPPLYFEGRSPDGEQRAITVQTKDNLGGAILRVWGAPQGDTDTRPRLAEVELTPCIRADLGAVMVP